MLHLTSLEEDKNDHDREDNRIFRFEARWIQHEGFDSCIKNVWTSSKARFRDQWFYVIDDCGSQLKQWHRKVYMATQNRLGWLIRRLKVVRKLALSSCVIDELRRVEQEL